MRVLQFGAPISELPSRLRITARAVHVQAGRDDSGLAEAMVEHNEAVVKPGAAIGQFEVAHRSPGKFRFNKILQIVTPISETTAQRKRQGDFVEDFVARSEERR